MGVVETLQIPLGIRCDFTINKVSGICAQVPVHDTLVYAAFLKNILNLIPKHHHTIQFHECLRQIGPSYIDNEMQGYKSYFY
jgi:hypothetical protein